jgi:ABC-type antimicrobial peptide transport system permease subunit
VSSLSRICMGLAVFLLVAGAVYGVTSHEPAGTTLLLVASATFWFLTFVTRHAAKQEEDHASGDEVEIHIGPTIWPFGFAIAALIVALGLIVSSWILIPGAVFVVVCAAGWFRDVARSHAPSSH